jgi:HEAT repeat protein
MRIVFPGLKTALSIVFSAAMLLLSAPAFAKGRVEALAERLESSPAGNDADKLPLVAALGATGDEDAAAPLLKQFQFRKARPGLLVEVAKALGRLKAKQAAGPLLACWDHLESMRLRGELPGSLQRLRAEVVDALGRIGDKKASPVVLAALADDETAVVRAGIGACARLKERKAVDLLIGLASSDAVYINPVYEALGEINDSRARAILLRGAAGDDPSAAAAASYALVRMGEKSGREGLKKLAASGKGRAELLAASYLARLDEDEGVDALLAVLNDRDSPFRETAASHLAKAGNTRAVGPVTQTLERSKDPALRRLCVAVLAGVGGSKSIRALKDAAEDKDASVAQAAAAGLVELGEED